MRGDVLETVEDVLDIAVFVAGKDFMCLLKSLLLSLLPWLLLPLMLESPEGNSVPTYLFFGLIFERYEIFFERCRGHVGAEKNL